MKSRASRYLRLAAMAVLVSGACEPGRPPSAGEFPIFLGAAGPRTYLVTSFRDLAPNSSHVEARIYQVDAQAKITNVARFTLPLLTEPSAIAAAVTETSGLIEVYGLAHVTNEEAIAFSFSDTSLVTVPIAMKDSHYCADGSLGVTNRGGGRRWVYYQEFTWNECAFANSEFPSLPLIEFEASHAAFIADAVVWADCAGEWCQQLRIDGHFLKLYASPVTGDMLARPVTSASLEYAGYFARYRAHHFRSCTTRSFGTLFNIDDGVFALSTTRPGLTQVYASTEKMLTAIDTDCPSQRVEPIPEDNLHRPYVADFSSGETLWAYEDYAGGVEDPDCTWNDRLLGGCSDIFTKFETHIVLFDKLGAKIKSFPLHDLRD